MKRPETALIDRSGTALFTTGNPGAVSQAAASTATATIASGASLSSAVDLSNKRLARIVIPSGWTTANLTVQTSYDGTNYADLYDKDGAVYTITVGGASRAIMVPLADFIGVQYLKLRSSTVSGTTITAVNQGAERSLILVAQ